MISSFLTSSINLTCFTGLMGLTSTFFAVGDTYSVLTPFFGGGGYLDLANTFSLSSFNARDSLAFLAVDEPPLDASLI